jgi:hypothetical protein
MLISEKPPATCGTGLLIKSTVCILAPVESDKEGDVTYMQISKVYIVLDVNADCPYAIQGRSHANSAKTIVIYTLSLRQQKHMFNGNSR